MSKHVTTATWDDVPHLSEEAKRELWESLDDYERDARSKGIPQLGSGAVFPVREEDLKCTPIPIPDHWAQIGALDFGWDHPFAAVRMAWDRDSDTVYVCNAYRQRKATPLIHCDAIKPWGWSTMPWAWPHDGNQHGKSDGKQLAEQYRKHGLYLLPDFARWEDGSNGVEAGITMMLEYMQGGRLKVFANLDDWFSEFRLYHRKKGLIVKVGEDLISATRYGFMSLRFAETPQSDEPEIIPMVVY